MTRKRNDEHSTEFGLWLREQKELESSLGFVASNLDYIWGNYKTGKWMLLEEKRHGRDVTYSQKQLFKKIHAACNGSENYVGIHLVVFENTSPDDGKIWLDRKEITKEDLILFLRFEWINGISQDTKLE